MPVRGFTYKVKVHDELFPVNLDTIFRRISLLNKFDAELQKYFEFELVPFPLSVGVACKFGEGVPAQVSSSSSDRGSKLRGPSQNSPRVASKLDVNIT
ncbi:hypothetical protein AVEN_118870-1 [Araneus ventricosus]|uniref:Uncharacterized protein n=1 Tax=Araneus ventricosus TaxID=182803 RepID=A0A4Y2MWD3_ARAVE|nr:hypothetical protein AVEN_118870-1 [Araneus ventricosus]